jgi:hypothetical protein
VVTCCYPFKELLAQVFEGRYFHALQTRAYAAIKFGARPDVNTGLRR